MIWVLMILVGREPQVLPQSHATRAACEVVMHRVAQKLGKGPRLDCWPVHLPEGRKL